MLPLRFAARWRTASILLLGIVMIAAMMPAVWFWSDQKDLVSWFAHVDKLLHAITFMFLALWFAGQYRPESYWRIAIGLLAFGGLIEICQSSVTYRSAEWYDMIANVTGIGVGLVIAFLGPGGWAVWLEDRFVPVKAGTSDG